MKSYLHTKSNQIGEYGCLGKIGNQPKLGQVWEGCEYIGKVILAFNFLVGIWLATDTMLRRAIENATRTLSSVSTRWSDQLMNLDVEHWVASNKDREGEDRAGRGFPVNTPAYGHTDPLATVRVFRRVSGWTDPIA